MASQVTQLVNHLPANAGDTGDKGSIPGSGRSPGVGNRILVLLPGKFHRQRLCLTLCNPTVGYSPWGHKESDTTEQALRHAIQS